MRILSILPTLGALLLLVSVSLNAQSPAAWQLGEEQGLPSTTVYQIQQDRDGFIWLGTAKGLFRYDGRTFTKPDLSGLLGLEIVVVEIDAWNRVWFNTLGGQVGYLEKGEIKLLSSDSLPGEGLPWRLYQVEGQIWLGFEEDGASQLARAKFDESGALLTWQISQESNAKGYDRLLVWQGKILTNRFILNKENSLGFYTIEIDSIQWVKENITLEDVPSYGNGGISVEVALPEGALLLVKNQHIFSYHHEQAKLQTALVLPSLINRVNYWQGNLLALCKSHGVYLLDPQTFEVRDLWLPNTNINVFFPDREGNLWFGTTGDGIYIIPNPKLQHYHPSNCNLPQKEINSLFTSPTNQTIYAGLSNGLMYALPPGEDIGQVIEVNKRGRITFITEAPDGSIWLGCDAGIVCHSPNQPFDNHIPQTSTTKTILFDQQNNLWTGESTRARKYQYDPLIGPSSFRPKQDQFTQAIIKRTYAIYEIQDRVWIGTVEGIYYYQNDSLHQFLEEDQHFPYHVTAMTSSSDGSLWVSTSGHGVLRIQDHLVSERYNLTNGLQSNNSTCLATTGTTLLIGTDNGLHTLDLEHQTIALLDDRDGLPSNEINAVCARDQEVWLGTSEGLIKFDLAAIHENETIPSILLRSLKVNGRDTSLDQTLRLNHQQNVIDVAFFSPCFRARGREEYRYRLNGLGADWTQTSNRFARFHALPPGDYQFEVFAINEDGKNSAAPASIAFHVATPWWKTWWFYLGLLTLLILVSSGLVYWRQNDLRQRELRERDFQEKIQHLRLEALKTQMNPHFIYNALNAIQDFLVTENSDQALFYLSRFARLIRQIFDLSNRESISLDQELEFLQLYLDLEKLRFGDRVEVEMEVEENLAENAEQYQLPPLLLQPLIENAFKHGLMHKGQGGLLRISFSPLPAGRLQCTIEDNGIGRKQAATLNHWRHGQERQGSLQAIRERLEIFHSASKITDCLPLEIIDLQDQEGVALGTKINIIV